MTAMVMLVSTVQPESSGCIRGIPMIPKSTISLGRDDRLVWCVIPQRATAEINQDHQDEANEKPCHRTRVTQQQPAARDLGWRNALPLACMRGQTGLTGRAPSRRDQLELARTALVGAGIAGRLDLLLFRPVDDSCGSHRRQ